MAIRRLCLTKALYPLRLAKGITERNGASHRFDGEPRLVSVSKTGYADRYEAHHHQYFHVC